MLPLARHPPFLWHGNTKKQGALPVFYRDVHSVGPTLRISSQT